jgi:hypothetical protein
MGYATRAAKKTTASPASCRTSYYRKKIPDGKNMCMACFTKVHPGVRNHINKDERRETFLHIYSKQNFT